MPNLSGPFIRRPKATILLVAGFLALGVLAYFQLPVSSLPDVDFPTINVSASLPGASAETMASSVAGPLEQAFSNIAGVTSMSSTSLLGQTSVVIQFELERNIDAAAQDVQAAINAASGQLPKDLPNPPTYKKSNPNGNIVISLAISSDTLPLTEVQDFADDFLQRPIARMSGVGQVDYHGEQIPAVRVRLNPAVLAANGLDLEDVRVALTQATVNSPKGSLDGRERTLTIKSNDQLFKAAAYNNQIIAWRGGAPVRIRDVGEAIDGAQEARSAAWTQGRRGLIMDVHKLLGAKVDVPALTDRIRRELPALVRNLPPAIKVTVAGDRTQTTRASVNDVQLTLAITIGLVAFVIFLFIRDIVATLIPAVSIPLSLIGTFPVMYLCGYSLDNISLMGLTIAVGFVVDDAIVVLENIVRHLELGKPRLQAALDGAAEVGFTIVSMTLSLISVFLPLLLMGGLIGRLFREFAVTVSVAVVLSAIISLTQTAVACSLFLRRENSHKPHGVLYRATERGFIAMLGVYRSGLTWILRHQFVGLLVTAGMFLASVGLFIVIPKGFVPEQDIGVIYASTEATPDITFAEMGRKQQELTQLVMQDPDIDNVYSFVEPRPAPNLGRIAINLKPFGQRKATAAEVMARLRPRLTGVPGMRVFLKAMQDIQVGTSFTKTQYQYVLQDSDVTELYQWAELFHAELKRLPQLRDVATDLNPAAPSVSVVVDRDKAASYGISPAAIDATLYDAFGQRQVATIYNSLNQHKVILEVQPNWQLDMRSLEVLHVRSPVSGREIPLSALARLESSTAPMLVNHLNSLPAVTLSFNVAPGASLGDAVDAIRRAEEAIKKPDRLAISFQGSAKAFQDSLASQPLLLLAAIVVVYIILGVLYESFIHPLTILSSLPSATFGALLAMLIFHYDLSVITLVGLVLLVGIVKKNAIMMIDVALHLQRNAQRSAATAIFEASLLRFRPIMMTTMAALLGALPLALGHGAGSELRRPLGVAIVGGLLVSQFVTLYTVPIIFLYMDRLISWSDRAKSRAVLPGTPAVAGETPGNFNP
ncbi:MAG: acriflavin resistance protein [Lacunisphaera sp.]|nr:acriflavin resistance protein [Lacunisphaera sp.]